jgi:hypothetical protein
VAHEFCNAHHLRELKALIEIKRKPWAKKMFRLPLRAREAVRRTVEKRPTSLAEWTARRINIVYDAIVEKGPAFHQRNRRSNDAKARAGTLRVASAMVCSSVFATTRPPSCASATILTCRSPTTWPNKTSG